MPQFFDHVDITPGATTGWQTVDLSAQIPSGSTGVAVLAINGDASSTRLAGVRANGDAGAVQDYLGSSYRTVAYSKVLADRKIDLYKSNATTYYYLLYAFGSEAVFWDYASWVDKSDSTGAAWVDVDISAATGADTAIAGIFKFWEKNGDNQTHGLRKNGATSPPTAYYAGYRYAGCYIVPLDANEVCEQYVQTTTMDLYLIGYIKSGWTFPDPPTNLSLSTTGAYTNLSALPSGALGACILAVAPSTTAKYSHIRKEGTSTDVYYRMGYAQTIVESDASRLVEAKIETVDLDFYLIGYPVAETSVTFLPHIMRTHYIPPLGGF